MRYNGVIILRIVDFRDYFSFEEFWKNRKLFSNTSRTSRFASQLNEGSFESCCIDIVCKWIENKPLYYRIDDDGYISNTLTCKTIGRFEVYKKLNEQAEPSIQKNILGLCALYQLLGKGRQLERLEKDLISIKRVLSQSSVNFSSSLVEFEEGGKTIEAFITVNRKSAEFPVHLAWFVNKSDKHKVVLKDDVESDVIVKTINPSECALAVLSSDNSWVEELPCTCIRKDNAFKLVPKEEGSSDRLLEITESGKSSNNTSTKYCLDQPVLSFCADDRGYVYVIKDQYRPIHCVHDNFDSYVIRRSLLNRLDKDEEVLYAAICGKKLSVLTNLRRINLEENEVCE